MGFLAAAKNSVVGAAAQGKAPMPLAGGIAGKTLLGRAARGKPSVLGQGVSGIIKG